ncbi:hypothetical protein [Bradyrhizobium quebecense]|uniref:Uncharacterized protein n=2 Tax=Bradyrhizobium quebecense TaxID=2748629 RepID=A0ABS3MQ74_9BRAD|nr:hypothetical protein [Bradyrhizobium quebecense]UGY01392.1 hypothetical protein J4P68_0030385 [Bradyrhizobium quebecense]
MKKTLQERLKTIEVVRRAERTALHVVVGIGADVTHTPKTIRAGAMRSGLAVIFRVGDFWDARVARSDVKAGLQ